MRQSLNFGTDNVFYVWPGQPLRIFDIYHWRLIELYVHKFHVFLNPNFASKIRNKVKLATELFTNDKPQKPDINKVKRAIDQFLKGFQSQELSAHKMWGLEEMFSPQQFTAWLRISEQPVESFFIEDYENREFAPEQLSSKLSCYPVNSNLFLELLDEYELSLPVDNNRGRFPLFLGYPGKDIVKIKPLEEKEFLPIVDEFCGSFGSSGQGRVVTYTHHATVSGENLVCLPLARHGPHHFITLYFALDTPVEYDVIFTPPRRKIGDITSQLLSLGFTEERKKRGNAIFTRGDDVLHFYANIPGKETLGTPFLHSFILIVKNQGSLEAATRSRLIETLYRLFAHTE